MEGFTVIQNWVQGECKIKFAHFKKTPIICYQKTKFI